MFTASIILPYYRKKSFIKKTVHSILTQTFRDFEIIIIYDDDDKSELKFIKEIKNLDKRIKLVVNKKNLGAGLSRNVGISLSLGSYICFIDADDIWKKDKLEKQIKFMEENNYDVSHTSYEIVDEKNNTIGSRIAKTFKNFDELLPSCDIGLSTVIVKKFIFEKGLKFPSLKTKEDFVVWLEILKDGYEIYPLEKKLTLWTKSKNSLSASAIQKLKDSFILYHRYMKFNYIKSLFYTFRLSINYVLKNL